MRIEGYGAIPSSMTGRGEKALMMKALEKSYEQKTEREACTNNERVRNTRENEER
jgi:hypothetical protein